MKFFNGQKQNLELKFELAIGYKLVNTEKPHLVFKITCECVQFIYVATALMDRINLT